MTEPAPEVPVMTRRRLIAGGTALGIGGAIAILGTRDRVAPPEVAPSARPRPSSRPTSRPADGYNTRTAYDAAEAIYRRTLAQQSRALTNNGGTLAWGESRVLTSYLTMYQATGDIGYLDKLVRFSEPVLAARDDQQGQIDYLGRSLPGWPAAEPYTISRLDLLNTVGDPAIQVATAAKGGRVLVDVQPDPNGRFELRVRRPSGLVETIGGLSIDPADHRYVVRLLEQEYSGPAALTAVDLRPEPNRGDALAQVAGTIMTAQRYMFAVHTGMIAAPFAQFAALLRREPDLRRRYASRAAELLQAAELALHLHDADWRRLSGKAGIYTFAVGAPVRADGTFLPHNQYLAMARCLTLLHVATGNPDYRLRATLMLNLFRSDLSASSAPIWPYYWSGSQPYKGFGADETRSVYSPRMAPQRRAEDPSHGALDVEALITGFDAGLNVPVSLMTRLVATYFNRVVRRRPNGRWVTAERLSSRQTIPGDDIAASTWISLARWDRRVLNTVLALLDQIAPSPLEGRLLSVAAQLVLLR